MVFCGRCLSLGDEADGGVALVADQTDHVVLLELHQRIAELRLLQFILVSNQALFRLRVQEVEHVGVLDSLLVNPRAEVGLKWGKRAGELEKKNLREPS